MKALIVGIFKLIYKVLSFFNLQPTLFVSLIGVILYLTGTFKANPTVLFIFQIALIITLVYAVVESIVKMLGVKKQNKKSKGMQIVKQTDEQMLGLPPQNNNQSNLPSNNQQYASNQVSQPKYFRVKQNPNLVMAEYADRFELFKILDGQLVRIRIDYKK